MSRINPTEESRARAIVSTEPDGGYRIEERESEAPSYPLWEGQLRSIIEGRGTICMPRASAGDLPLPAPDTEDAGAEWITVDEIRRLWDRVAAESNKQAARQANEQVRHRATERQKSQKLELLLRLALKSGNVDLAMLLLSSLESRRSNEVIAGLMARMHELQQERRNLTSGLGQTGDAAKDAQQAQTVNAKVGDINTEMNMLQTFLQDVMAHKNETQQLTSQHIKSRDDTAMGIIRNIG